MTEASLNSDRTLSRRARSLHLGAWALLGATFVLLMAGGQVTSTESGDAVPTWPFPLQLPMTGGVLWELGHRQVAGAVGVLTLLFAGWVLWDRQRRGGPSQTKTVAKVALSALGLVIVQALLGGLRVRLGAQDPHAGTALESAGVRAIAITHACVAQAFLLLVVTLVAWTRPGRPDHVFEGSTPLRRLALVTTGATYLQIVLGAVLRHTMTDAGLLVHVGGALAVLVLGAILAGRVLAAASSEGLRRPALGLGIALAIQTMLGIFAYVLVNDGAPRGAAVTAQAVVPTLHLVVGGAILACCHLIHLRSRHADAPADALAKRVVPAGGGVR